MGIYEELQARGLIAQVTDEEHIRDMVNNGKATFYIGFDCTADSLHVGHFMALCLMKRLQMAGNRPIALIGGGTTMIGDPSGRTDMRKMLTKEDIDHNAACFKRQMERFIDFGPGKAMMLNNADWLLDLNYVELLREVGACFSVNNMLRAECYKQRMEKGLSFLEFNYMIMQSYDFYYMFQHYGPEAHQLGADVRAIWEENCRESGGSWQSTDDRAAVRGADFIYTDVWYGLYENEMPKEERVRVFHDYQVNRELMQLGNLGCKFLHCLPATRGEDVTDEVIDSAASLCWEQAGNRLTAMRGLLVWLTRDKKAPLAEETAAVQAELEQFLQSKGLA